MVKQFHHEPCAYYTFGNKIEAELRDYQRLRAAGIRIPAMIACDKQTERIVKEYMDAWSFEAWGRPLLGHDAGVSKSAGGTSAAGKPDLILFAF